ncbi:MAG: hypothetical protein E4H01_12935 [Lysobacterales bacterium]|nr:MAG: hypothetical protein E4H01_12935 [Xanthomonadales bacterium]
MSQLAFYMTLLSAAALAGCGTPSGKHTADETGAITVRCNNSSLRWNACYETAANLCGQKGYQIVSSDDSGMPSVTTNAYEVPVIGESLVIRCNQ